MTAKASLFEKMLTITKKRKESTYRRNESQ